MDVPSPASESYSIHIGAPPHMTLMKVTEMRTPVAAPGGCDF